MLSYADDLFFGILADYGVVADVDQLSRGIEVAIAQLVAISNGRGMPDGAARCHWSCKQVSGIFRHPSCEGRVPVRLGAKLEVAAGDLGRHHPYVVKFERRDPWPQRGTVGLLDLGAGC